MSMWCRVISPSFYNKKAVSTTNTTIQKTSPRGGSHAVFSAERRRGGGEIAECEVTPLLINDFIYDNDDADDRRV